MNDVNIGSASAPVSVLDFCPDTLHLAVGDESGFVSFISIEVFSILTFSSHKMKSSIPGNFILWECRFVYMG